MKTIKNLFDRKQTVEEMKRLAELYTCDIANIKDNAVQFFERVKKIKYLRDTYPFEVVERPKYIINQNTADCKKKAILMLSYAFLKKIPNRIVVMSNRPDRVMHHVFIQYFINGEWINFDNTYPKYYIGMPKKTTNIKIYEGLK